MSIMGLQGRVSLERTLQEALDGRRETAKIRSVWCGCGSMVECDLPTVETRVRFPSPAPLTINDLHKSAGKVQENLGLLLQVLGSNHCLFGEME